MSISRMLLLAKLDEIVAGIIPDGLSYLDSAGVFNGPGNFIATATDQSVPNSNVPVASALALNLAAAATYTYEALLVYDGTITGDFRSTFTWPSGTGWYCADSALATSGAAMTTLFSAVSGGTLSIGALGVGSKQLVRIDGFIKTVGAITLQHKFAQNTADPANPSTLYTGSWLAIKRRA